MFLLETTSHKPSPVALKGAVRASLDLVNSLAGDRGDTSSGRNGMGASEIEIGGDCDGGDCGGVMVERK